MDEKIIKTAYKEAEDSLKERQAGQVKMIVLKTLEKIENLKTEREMLNNQLKSVDEDIKILKMDIDDLKDGRLDRIEERQNTDERANRVSVAHLRKEPETAGLSFWYWPYLVESLFDMTTNMTTNTITPSSARWTTTGTYILPGGRVLNLR